MSAEPTIDRLSAYLDDELSPKERELLEQQLSSSEALREQLEKLRQVKDWFRDYPGREPKHDAWRGIAARVESGLPLGGENRSDAKSENRTSRRGLFLLPGFAPTEIPTTAKRFGIGAMILLALGGMGRQFVLEQRADALEDANTLRDRQLIKYVTANKWSMTATKLRGEDGRRISIVCPPSGEAATVWGSGIYTDDSSICTAGVHSGAITLDEGGVVTIEILPGATEYQGSVQNGIESRSYASWRGSFAVLSPDRDRRVLGLDGLNAGVTSWDASAIELRGLNGTRVSFMCPADGDNRGPIWGTDTYTDDSSICTAAVHAGRISFEEGGLVTIQIVPGQPEYVGTTRNGVESRDFDDWSGSFVFVTNVVAAPDPSVHFDPAVRPRVDVDVNPTVIVGVDPDVSVKTADDFDLNLRISMQLDTIDWTSTATEMGNWVGTRTELTCPPNGSQEPVWGTDTYMVSSSICTAAVHAGLITFEDGGDVSIEIRPGQSTYSGSTRNGVSTRTHRTSDAWQSSFAFVGN